MKIKFKAGRLNQGFYILPSIGVEYPNVNKKNNWKYALCIYIWFWGIGVSFNYKKHGKEI